PLLATSRLDSEFYADDGQYPFAKARLALDPRVAHLHDGITSLYRFLEARNADFLLDWKVLPAGAPMPPPPDLVADPALPLYPRAATERERAVEGYVDGRRLGAAAGCIGFARAENLDRPTRLVLEVSPYGSAEVYTDDQPTAAIPSPRAAVLGRRARARRADRGVVDEVAPRAILLHQHLGRAHLGGDAPAARTRHRVLPVGDGHDVRVPERERLERLERELRAAPLLAQG